MRAPSGSRPSGSGMRRFLEGRGEVKKKKGSRRKQTGRWFFYYFCSSLLLLSLSLCFHVLRGEREAKKATVITPSVSIINIVIAALLMRPATAAWTAASSALGGWAMSRRRCPVVAAAAALHSSASTLSPPRQQHQQHRRGLPQPARAGARDAAMRELMASRDDARADSLKSKAPLGEID